MLYTERIRLWHEAVQAVDSRDWQGALSKLSQITEPTSRTLFVYASVYLALGQLEPAIRALDQTIAKDERLAVGFFQRAAVHLMVGRLEEAMSDCIWAQKHMRGNPVIDYKQLGLRFKLNSWQVIYNAAAVQCRMGLWDKAWEMLLTMSQEKGGRGGQLDTALESIARREFLTPLLVPEGEVFRPRKQDVEQLPERDFLGKAKVISSIIPNDDFGGFEPLRLQKPGYYEPKGEGEQESRYMRLRSTYIAQDPAELTVPGGGLVFMFSDGGMEGRATVFYDGKRGLVPISMLESVDVTKFKKKKELRSVPNGIPLPPGLKPPTRPETRPRAPSPQLATSGHLGSPPTPPPQYSSVVDSPTERRPSPSPIEEGGSVVVKVHYKYTLALNVPVGTPYSQLQETIARKVGHPATNLRLRQRQHDSRVLKPLDGDAGLRAVLEEATESGRAILWCQPENPLQGRTILYQLVAQYDYSAQGPEDLEFNEGDTIDILSEA
ncbi:NADPH oxidase activator 1 isoform X2 [Conger conger]|uniref:NADPH oxidase activator 1 isoform X2 n=1 Tax=Conger conger TaxID=82655 RepID=UPI002A5A0F8E|nr:NADPH oxidase activator 1 isoform X2 [Conger conger]